MSNRRSSRRPRQRRRYEKSRKPSVITKAMSSRFDAMPAERERKAAHAESEAFWRERHRAADRRRWLGKPRKQRKPRTVYGKTFWTYSHDV